MVLKKKVQLEVISDYICPWCYLGIIRLSRLKKEMQEEIDLSIDLSPFFLYPNIPVEGKDKKAFASKTKPGMGKALKYEAEKEGISINYKLIDKIPNSSEAHRLTTLVNNNDQKWQLGKAIFKAYFEQGQNIGDKEVLANIGNQIDLSSAVLDQFSKEHAGQSQIQEYITKHTEEFVTVVPSVRFDNRLLVSGLQEDKFWKKMMRKSALLQK